MDISCYKRACMLSIVRHFRLPCYLWAKLWSYGPVMINPMVIETRMPIAAIIPYEKFIPVNLLSALQTVRFCNALP